MAGDVNESYGLLKKFSRNDSIRRVLSAKRKAYVSINNPRRTTWDLIIMILAIYNCYCIPVDVAFSPPEFNTTLIKTINGMIDFAFFIDILVSFRTTFMD
jgi:hypothetical protein